jgi:hypothetical protein
VTNIYCAPPTGFLPTPTGFLPTTDPGGLDGAAGPEGAVTVTSGIEKPLLPWLNAGLEGSGTAAAAGDELPATAAVEVGEEGEAMAWGGGLEGVCCCWA